MISMLPQALMERGAPVKAVGMGAAQMASHQPKVRILKVAVVTLVLMDAVQTR